MIYKIHIKLKYYPAISTVNRAIPLAAVLVFFQIVMGVPLVALPDSVIDLASRREIFVDDFLIERLDGVHITMHRPHKEESALTFDKPWEGKYSGFFTIIKDDHLYRAYYRGLPSTNQNSGYTSVVCYAESIDGKHWVKPNLGISKRYQHTPNNIVLEDQPAAGNFSPFLDLNPTAKEGQKFKAIGGHEKEGLKAYVSGDGINWELLTEKPILTKRQGDPQLFDSQNVAFWSESEKKYICYLRTRIDNKQGDDRIRSVARSTSEDFINWTEPVNMTFDRGGFEHLYIQQTSPYYRAPHIYVALAARFMKNRQIVSLEDAKKLGVDPNQIQDCSDAVLITSRGGTHYNRTFMESFVRPEIGLNNWTSRTNYPGLNIVETGADEMSFYMTKDYAQPTAHVSRYSMRVDGLSSVRAPFSGGELTTRPFIFSGEQLEINYSTSVAGELRFEFQDINGNAISGFSAEDSRTIIGNEIKRIVSWKGGQNVGALSGKIVRLRIVMKDADLYSLKFN